MTWFLQIKGQKRLLMTYINAIKSYRRGLLKKLFDSGETNVRISDLTEYSESWIRTLRTKYEKEQIDLLALHKPGVQYAA
jgi:hypothetical protein